MLHAMIIDLKSLTIKKAHEHLMNGDFSAMELSEAYLKNIDEKNKDLNAYLEVYDDVLEQAKAADERIAKKDVTPLTGIPISVKDVIVIEGKPVSASSKILAGYKGSYDATVIKKLKAAGAVFLGRTNCDEFAMGGSTENSAFGVTRNPHDLSRVAGGSSGGSAASVAADLALASLGSDTGGSIREPASFCGVVGLKPTYGAVSRSGLIAMGSSLDCIGPFTKTVEDAGILFDVIKGKDPLDSTSIDTPRTEPKKKFRVGVPRSFTNIEGVDKDILENFNASLERLKEKGVEIVDIELPHLPYALACYYIIMPAEASTNLARFDGVKYGLRKDGTNLLGDYLETRREGFGPEVRRRILIGTYVLSSGYYDAYYSKALEARELIRNDFKKAFEKVDVVATPAAPIAPWKIGEKTDPLSVYLADIFTVTANIAGIPGISVPCGFKEVEGNKLPLGLQFMAPWGEERMLLDLSGVFAGE